MQFKKTAFIASILLALGGCNDNNSNNSNSDNLKNTSSLTTKNFNRIATYAICSQINTSCNTDTVTSAEIVAASTDGNTLVYTDSPRKQVGFVNISEPSHPVGLGTVALAGEPTSVAIKDGYALVAVNTSSDFVNVSGQLAVVDIATRTILTNVTLAGQPDAVAVSPDGTYAAIVIENERDEDLGDGAPPQLPAGMLQIIALSAEPSTWAATSVDFTGIADLYSGDPEPEYVDINSDNIAVVTLQENNHIILVDLKNGTITSDFTAGSVDLTQIDATEGSPMEISLSESLSNIPREPDGVAWINNEYFVTADEGDLNGGSRGFTVFNTKGDVVYSSGNELDHMAVRYGHYPDKRSENKGNEPENAEVATYGNNHYLFINSERSSLVFVYDITNPTTPVFKQVLPAATGPEGALAIPSRNLLVIASEKDSRDDKMRAALNIYQYTATDATYPTVVSADRLDGTPIPWGAMSGLSSDNINSNTLYAIEDSFYKSNRIFTIDVNTTPATITTETPITDANDVFSSLAVVEVDNTQPANHATRIDVFDDVDLAAMINNDKTVNIDPEGIAKATDGGFWIASEGNGTVGDASRPINSLNFIFKTDANGVIEDVISLPPDINNKQVRFGFEGVTEYNGNIYVAFQRVWTGDTNVRIGIYDTTAKSWTFLFYPLDTVASQNGGWVGLSDISALGNGEFLALERDNQGGPDAAIKRLYKFNVTGLVDGDTVTKTLAYDLMNNLVTTHGHIAEKVEGLAIMSNGDVYIVNDNDGVDDNSGETQLINLGNVLN